MRKLVTGGVLALVAGATLFTSAGSAFAAVGDAPGVDVAAGAPVAASSSNTSADATVVVDGSISLALDDADKSFALQGQAGAQNVTSSDNTISYIVTTNNTAGYAVRIQSDAPSLVPADTTANTDVIPFDDITASGQSYADGSVANGGASYGFAYIGLMSGGVIYSQTGRSDATGDEHKTVFSANIPFVNKDTYTGTVTFTATAS